MGKTQLNWMTLAAAAVGMTSCAQEEIGEARYSPDQCRRVALVNAEGAVVRGAEDLALDRAGARLFVSAYDRRAAEKAAGKRNEAPPSGGVYALPLETLFDSDTDQISVTSLAAPGDFTGGLRPHGLHYDAANQELVFINRTYLRYGRKWRMTPKLQRIGANGEMFVGEAKEAPCAANDVTSDGADELTTFDHATCGFGAGLEDVFRLKRSGFSNKEGPVFEKAAFANGIANLENGKVALAATRESALLIVDVNSADVTQRITLPGGPDNVSLAEDGKLIAAVHPKMLKLAVNRKLGWGRAPSRIVKADAKTGNVDILFDDPNGTLFSAATAAVETPQGLVAGSVTDEGLLVCQEPA